MDLEDNSQSNSEITNMEELEKKVENITTKAENLLVIE